MVNQSKRVNVIGLGKYKTGGLSEMSFRTFYAAKINIHGNILSPNLDELINHHIPRVILQSIPLKINTWNWTFTDVEPIKIQGNRYIVGNVTKSKYLKQKVRIGSRTERKKSEYEIAHTAFFVYDPNGEILIHESTSAISALDFRNLFTKLLSRDPYVGEVKIIPIPTPYKIRKELLSIEKITKIHFHLIHPNPGREEFNLYQQIIHDAGLLELDIAMNNVKGIDIGKPGESGQIEFSKPIENGIALVESGYGDIDIKGHDEIIVQGKRKKKVNIKKRSFSSKNAVRYFKTTENDQERLLNRIVSFILDVKNKVDKGDDHGNGFGA